MCIMQYLNTAASHIYCICRAIRIQILPIRHDVRPCGCYFNFSCILLLLLLSYFECFELLLTKQLLPLAQLLSRLQKTVSFAGFSCTFGFLALVSRFLCFSPFLLFFFYRNPLGIPIASGSTAGAGAAAALHMASGLRKYLHNFSMPLNFNR